MKKDFSETLKDLRIQAGYTQKQVYDLLGVRQSTFSAWETGRAEPSADMLLKLCKLYKVNDIFSAFGYDGYNEDGSIQLNLPEIELIEKYRFLDHYGKEVIDVVLDKEYTRCQEQNKVVEIKAPEKPYLVPDAAHKRTDIEQVADGDQRDDDIMDDDSEWE